MVLEINILQCKMLNTLTRAELCLVKYRVNLIYFSRTHVDRSLEIRRCRS